MFGVGRSAAMMFLNSISRNQDGRGDMDLYSSGVEDALNALDSGEDLDSGAIGDRLRGAIGNWQQKRGAALTQRGAGNLAKVGQVSAKTVQTAQAVAEVQVSAEARRAQNKSRFKLYRMIPLLAPASRADAAVVAISVTPPSRGFAEYITCNGVYRIDSLVINGQGILPSGAVSSAAFQAVSNSNLPVNQYLNTVPITGQITNNTGSAVYATMDMMTWLEDDASSERY